MMTPAGARKAALLNVSKDGAMLCGAELPPEGSSIWIKVATVELLVTVTWVRDQFCGVTFDGVLNDKQLDALRRESRAAVSVGQQSDLG